MLGIRIIIIVFVYIMTTPPLFTYFVNNTPLKTSEFVKIGKPEHYLPFIGKRIIFDRSEKKFNAEILAE